MVVLSVTMSNLASHVTPTTDTTTDQENVSPVDPVVNVRNDARKAMAMHIDGSTKESKKRARRDRLSDAEKIESVFTSSDCIESLVSLIDDVRFFLESGHASTSIAIEALKYISSAGKVQLNQIRKSNQFYEIKDDGSVCSQEIYQSRAAANFRPATAAPHARNH